MSANMNKEPLIRVQDLGKSFGSIHVLKGINVNIYKGDVGIFSLRERISRTPRSILTSTGRRWAWCSSSLTCSPTWIS